MLLCASSPYARRGALWDAHRRHYGKEHDPVLIWHAATKVMNASVPQSIIDDAFERNSASAAAEWNAEFRSDLQSFVPREVVESCITLGCHERTPLPGVNYVAFTDPAGGSGTDSMTLAIAHRQDDVIVLDAIREIRPPFSPEAACAEFCALLKLYRVTTVVGDKFAGEWPRERFSDHGVKYDAAAEPKSILYRDLLPALNSRKLDLLDHPRLLAQTCGLERRTARGGRDVIDHAPNNHDDLSNVLAGAVSLCGASTFDSTYEWVGTFDDELIRQDTVPLPTYLSHYFLAQQGYGRRRF
jgi:hypothetical protein